MVWNLDSAERLRMSKLHDRAELYTELVRTLKTSYLGRIRKFETMSLMDNAQVLPLYSKISHASGADRSIEVTCSGRTVLQTGF